MTSGVDQERRLLTKAALAEPSIAVAAWSEWSKTFKGPHSSSQLSWAGGYIYKNLLAAGVIDDYVKGLYRHNWTKNNHTRLRTLPALREVSEIADVLLVKSFGFTHSGYSLGFRPIADVDLYVSVDYLAVVAERLNCLGYEPLLGVTVETLIKKIVLQRGSWNLKLEDGTDIDLHWKLFDHLSNAENKELTERYSSLVDTEFGRRRVLNAEMSLAYQVHTFALQLEKRFNGLFDVYSMSSYVNLDTTALHLRDLDLIEETCQLTDELMSSLDLQSSHPISKLRKLVGGLTAKRRVVNLHEQRLSRIDADDLRYPKLYSAWFRHGTPSWIEFLHNRLLGPMSRREIGRSEAGDRSAYTFVDPNEVPVGFHYLYPASRYRWLHKGDARIRFNLRTATLTQFMIGRPLTIRIVVDYDNWKITPTREVNVYLNGRRVGTIAKHQSSLTFRRRFRRSHLEISFRTSNQSDRRESGAYFNWYQMLLPLFSIELAETLW